MTIDPNWVAAHIQHELWRPTLVRNAFVFALRVDRAVPARIGPAGDRAFWPESSSSDDDEQEERLEPTRADITHAEWVLVGYRDKSGAPRPAWLNGAIIGYPVQRQAFRRWATWASKGKVDRDGVGQTDDDFARQIHMSERTLLRHIDFTCDMIARALNESGLKVWHVERPKRRENRQAGASAA